MADVCLVGGEEAPGAERDEIDVEALAAQYPNLIILEITGWVDGADERTPAVDLLVQARTGFVFEQFTGRPGYVAFQPALYGAALVGLLGIWAALLQRQRTRRGQIVRVSLQQGLSLFWQQLLLQAEYPDDEFNGVPPRDVEHMIYRCADGDYIQITFGVAGAQQMLYEVLGIPDAVDPAGRGVPGAVSDPTKYYADNSRIAPFVAAFDRSDLLARLAERGIPAAPALDPGGCFDDPQVQAAGLVAADEAGRQYLRGFVSLRFSHSAPATATGNNSDRRRDDETPLSGIRIVDMGRFVSGPFAGKLLADLGADVVRVEPPPGTPDLNGLRNTWVSNCGKRSIRIDLRDADGVTALRRIAADADVVMHNFRLGVAERLGVDAVSLRCGAPDLIYLHTTSYGAHGPSARLPGWDMIMQALTGQEVRAGGLGNPPLWVRSPIVDYTAATLGAIGVLAALYERSASGSVTDVDVSLLSAALFLECGSARTPDKQALGLPCLASNRMGFHPAESLYSTSDGWIAVYARGDEASRRLADAIGLRKAGPASTWTEDHYRRIAARLSVMTTAEATAALDSAGVWASPCAQDFVEFMHGDPAARLAGLVVSTRDAKFGRITGSFGPLASWSAWHPDTTDLPLPPASGADTAEVLAEAGYSPDEVRVLIQEGSVYGPDRA
jgi:crotonobetainyl-CoA:carnitine CoA-transferase CaiB-like acyl-CoA transferase